MKTQGEIEAAACNSLARFALEYLGREPRAIRTYLVHGLLVVRLQGMLSAAEQQMFIITGAGKGMMLVKQMRTELIETARPILTSLVEDIMGTKVLSLHHDLSTVSGEEFIIFTFVEVPPRHTSRK